MIITPHSIDSKNVFDLIKQFSLFERTDFSEDPNIDWYKYKTLKIISRNQDNTFHVVLEGFGKKNNKRENPNMPLQALTVTLCAWFKTSILE